MIQQFFGSSNVALEGLVRCEGPLQPVEVNWAAKKNGVLCLCSLSPSALSQRISFANQQKWRYLFMFATSVHSQPTEAKLPANKVALLGPVRRQCPLPASRRQIAS